jgi:MFS family permease
MTAQQWQTYGACWVAGLASGTIASTTPTYLPFIASTFGAQDPAAAAPALGAMLQASFLIGWILGGIGLGFMADVHGRPRVLTAAFLLAIGGSCLAPLAGTDVHLAMLRGITGLCVGAVMAISTTLGAETIPDDRRPLLMGLLANSYAFGIVLSGALQASHVPYATTSVVPLMLAPSAFVILRARRSARPSGDPSHTYMQRVSASRRDLVVGSILFGCILIALWAAFSWLPTWASTLFPGTDAGASARGLVMMALGGGGIVGSIFAGPVARRIGRVRSLGVCYAGAAVMSLLLYGLTPAGIGPFAAFVAVLTVFFGMSQGLMAFYIPELFPRRIRAMSVGLCFNVGRLTTALAVLQIGVIAASLGGFRQALMAFSSTLVAGMITLRFAREPEPFDH